VFAEDGEVVAVEEFVAVGHGCEFRSCLIYAFAAPDGSVRPASIAGPIGRVVAFRRFMRQLLADLYGVAGGGVGGSILCGMSLAHGWCVDRCEMRPELQQVLTQTLKPRRTHRICASAVSCRALKLASIAGSMRLAGWLDRWWV
jgi:hypothetical protein